MKLLLPLSCVLALTGCANTGTNSVGKDTYMTNVRVSFSGIAGAQSDALSIAGAHCEAMGKKMLLGELTSNGCMLRGGCAEAQIVYSCLDKDDPRYKEPNMKRD
jgi:hypothetical protein